MYQDPAVQDSQPRKEGSRLQTSKRTHVFVHVQVNVGAGELCTGGGDVSREEYGKGESCLK